jgi:hypothetical protein
MEQPPAARSDKGRIGWWEYPVIALIAVSSLPAYAALLMALIAAVLIAFPPAILRETNSAGRLQAWGDIARFFAMATGPIAAIICIVVSFASFRSRATKLGWLILLGGILAWFIAGFLIGRP